MVFGWADGLRAWLIGTLVSFPLASVATAALVVDGRIERGEWAGARHINDFRGVQPLTRAPAELATEAWVMSTPDGLAIAFRNAQPQGVPRLAPRGSHPARRVYIIV